VDEVVHRFDAVRDDEEADDAHRGERRSDPAPQRGLARVGQPR
jgi:hypothetical protein